MNKVLNVIADSGNLSPVADMLPRFRSGKMSAFKQAGDNALSFEPIAA